MDYEHHYKRFPALAAYIDRIGAEQLNFRRFMVKEFHGKYYIEKVLIKINSDLTIECRIKSYEPTPEEAIAIAEELTKADFPVSVKATPAQVEALRKSDNIKGELYSFYDVDRRAIIMCQERREKDDGKYYIPWSMFSDKKKKAVWVSMEADGALPFWKPEKKRDKSIVMVHEGAKTAAFVDGLLNDPLRRAERKDYPKEWIDFLDDREHWGAIGGALASHRCDYEELHKMKIEDHIEYSCDNDAAGVEASKTFSRNMSGKEVRVIKYDTTFRPGWDLADPLPADLFDETGRVKRTLEDFCRPATWATQKADKEKKGAGRTGYTLTMKFREEWYHCTEVGQFYHATMPGHEYSERSFNSFVRPFSDADDTARYVRTSEFGKVDNPSYDPSRPYGPFNYGDGKNLYFNTYSPPRFQDYSAAEAKRLDHKLLEEFFDRLIPDKGDRHKLVKWCATLCARPDIKMDYASLVVSEMQGVGKSTLGNLLRGIVGPQHTSQPNEKSLTDERNSWAAKRRLAIIPEIYQGHKAATYNILKSLITEKVIWVNEKYVQEYQLPNWAHIYANSNSLVPLLFDHSDRRWLIPRCTEERSPHAFWVKFNDYMDKEEGYRRARQFFIDFVREHGPIFPGEAAPDTTAKRDMIKESYSPGQELVQDALEWIANPDQDVRLNGDQAEMARVREAFKSGKAIIATDRDGVQGIEQSIDDKRRLEKITQPQSAVCRVARNMNFYVGTERNATRYFHKNARVISLDQGLARARIVDLVRRIEADEILYARLGLLMEERKAL